jgi:hypothetical protein
MFRRNILSPSSGQTMSAFPTKLKLQETVLPVYCYNSCVTIVAYESVFDFQFRLNVIVQFYETDFMQLVSSLNDPPKS